MTQLCDLDIIPTKHSDLFREHNFYPKGETLVLQLQTVLLNMPNLFNLISSYHDMRVLK